LEYFFALSVGLIAGTVGGIVGFGSSIMLVRVLVVAFGPRAATSANRSHFAHWARCRSTHWRVGSLSVRR